MQKTKGISLIVLVITIIIMIILAGTVILTTSNIKIIPQAEGAVQAINIDEVQTLVDVLWSDTYIAGYKTDAERKKYILDGLKKSNISTVEYAITVSDRGAKAVFLPEGYRGGHIATIVDGVAIPSGFVASEAKGENKKDTGLVIYEGTESVTNANVETAKRERNQYVWIPVEDFSKFVRQNLDGTDTISNTLGSNFWEVVLNTTTNMPLDTQSTSYVSSTTLAEVQAMYASVKKYQGFYIARYEAGLETPRTSNTTLTTGSKVYSMMGKAPYTHISWGGSISDDTTGTVYVARSVYPNDSTNTTGVISTLTYGVQWDRTLAWWLEVGAKTGIGETITNIAKSTTYGNYSDNEIALDTFNEGAQYTTDNTNVPYNNITTKKAAGTQWMLTTGATEETKVNNIYDMAGNIWERTMEGYTSTKRVLRGNVYKSSNTSVALRGADGTTGAPASSGFRLALYIK